MASFYVVAQYVPDPVIDERINIGVFVYGENGEPVLCRFLRDWQRVKCFTGDNIDFLRSFAKSMESEPVAPRSNVSIAAVSEPELKEMSVNWGNSIQLTAPRGSLLSVDGLMNHVASRFLPEPIHIQRQARTRLQAAAEAGQYVRKALVKQLGPRAANCIKRRDIVWGKRETHSFDIIVGNGQPVWITQGMSFEGPDSKERDSTIGNLAWSIEDLRQSKPDLPVWIAALEPKVDGDAYENYERVQNVFKDLGAEIVTEDALPTWAEDQAQDVAPQLREHLDDGQ